MSAHATFTAEADNLFRVTEKIRREINSLSKLATNFKFGGRSSGGANAELAGIRAQAAASRAATGEIKRQTAELQKQETAARIAARTQTQAAQIVRDAQRQQREELRKQREAGATWAREIDAGYRRNGDSLNRFGERVKTVTGYLKNISRDMRVDFKVDPNGNIKTLMRQIRDAQRAAGALEVNLNTTEAQREIEELARSLSKLRSQSKVSLTVDERGGIKRSAVAAVDRTGERKAARGELSQRAAGATTMAGGGMLATLGFSLKQFVDWEAAFTGVAKTVNATDAELAKLSAQLRVMATEIPVSAKSLATIAENAGQLGIQTKSIAGFTRVMADLAVTTNLTADQASTDLAKIANITKMPQAQFDRLGSTIVALGNTGASTEKEIVEMSLRIAGAGKQVGLSNAEILAFASTLSSVGIEAEAGGSAISRVFVEIDKAARNGGENLDRFAKAAGMSSSQFQKLFKKDAADGIAAFVAGLGKIQKSGGDVFGTLEKLGLSEIRVRDALLRMGGNSELLNKSLQDADAAWKSNNALTKEAEKRYATTAAKAEIAKNQLNELAIISGEVLVPALTAVLKQGGGLLKWFTALPAQTQTNIVKWTALAGVGLLLIGRVKALIEVIVLLREAQLLAGTASLIMGSKFGVALLAMKAGAISSMAAIRVALLSASPILAALAISVAGFATAFYGARDAGTMSAEALINKWGALGRIWDSLGTKLGNLMNLFNRSHLAAGDAAERESARISAAVRRKPPMQRQGPPRIDGSHARGLVRVPKDDYRAVLHKDEAVLTAAEARQWRRESGSGESDNSMARSQVLSIASDIRIPKALIGRECAFFVSEFFRAARIDIKDNVARNLRDKAAKRARRIPLDEASAGDMIVWQGGKYGAKQKGERRSGYHVGVALGDGQVIQRNRNYRGPIYDREHAYAYDTSALQGSGRARGAGVLRPSMRTEDTVSGLIPRRGDATASLTPKEKTQLIRTLFGGVRGTASGEIDAAGREELRLGKVAEEFQQTMRELRAQRGYAQLENSMRSRGTDESVIGREVEYRKYAESLKFKGFSWEQMDEQLKAFKATQDETFRTEQIEKYKAAVSALSDKAFEASSGTLQTIAEYLGDAAFNAERLAQVWPQMIQSDAPASLLANLQQHAARNTYNQSVEDVIGQARAAQADSQTNLQSTLDSTNRVNPVQSAKRTRSRLLNEFADQVMRADPGVSPEQIAADYETVTTALNEYVDAVSKAYDAEKGSMVSTYLRDVQDRVALTMEQDPIEREILNIRQTLTRDEWSEEDIQKVLPTARWGLEMEKFQARAQEFSGQLTSIFDSGLDGLQENGLSGFFQNVAQGFGNLINNISKQVLSATFTKIIMGWFPQLADVYGQTQDKVGQLAAQTAASAVAAYTAATAYAAAAATAFAIANAAAGGAVPSPGAVGNGMNQAMAGASAGFGAAFASMIPGHAAGLERVPRHNYVARLHKDEAVLNASDAAVWRDRQQSLSGGAAAAMMGGGAVTVMNTFHIGSIQMPDGTDADNFVARVEDRASRRTLRQTAAHYVNG